MSNANRNNTQNEYKYHTVFVLLDWLERFSRNTQATNRIKVTKNFVCQNKFVFNILPWQKSWSEKLELMCDSDNRNKIFFPVVRSETNCPSDGLVKTTKSSLPFSPAVDQSVSWIYCSNSIPLRILLSRNYYNLQSVHFEFPVNKHPQNSLTQT